MPKAVPRPDRADILRCPQRGVVPEFAEKVGTLGVFPKATSPEALDAIIRKEIERWTAIAQSGEYHRRIIARAPVVGFQSVCGVCSATGRCWPSHLPTVTLVGAPGFPKTAAGLRR